MGLTDLLSVIYLHSFPGEFPVDVGDDDSEGILFFIGGIPFPSRFRLLYGTNKRTGPV